MTQRLSSATQQIVLHRICANCAEGKFAPQTSLGPHPEERPKGASRRMGPPPEVGLVRRRQLFKRPDSGKPEAGCPSKRRAPHPEASPSSFETRSRKLFACVNALRMRATIEGRAAPQGEGGER